MLALVSAVSRTAAAADVISVMSCRKLTGLLKQFLALSLVPPVALLMCGPGKLQHNSHSPAVMPQFFTAACHAVCLLTLYEPQHCQHDW